MLAHGILLSTASLDIYVPDIQNWFSINQLICTNTLWQGDCLTGELDGNNYYGLEKLTRVKSYIRKHNISGKVSVYSDHASDWQIMNYADKAYAVYPTKK